MPTTILGVSHAPLNMAKSFLLLGERVVAIDAGNPGGEQRIARALQDAGRSPKDVSLVLVTHGHPDHAGAAAALARLTGAPIAADPREVRYLERHELAPLKPTGFAGRMFLCTPLPHTAFEPFTPNVLVDDAFDLRRYGVDARVLRSGGHTAGSLSVVVPETGDVIAADLLAGGIGIGGVMLHDRVTDPPFHDDPVRVRVAVEELLGLPGLHRFHVCHGGPLRPKDVERWLRRG
jgi:glyoxylase-like metal-dependent hydrolase (beta-lactamase superfamily II)